MVPMLTCGLVRSNLAFATSLVLLDCVLPAPPLTWGPGRVVCFVGPAVSRRTEMADSRLARADRPPARRSAARTVIVRAADDSLARRLRDDLLGHAGRD